MLYTMYTVEKAESCLVCQFSGCSCHHVAWEIRGWKNKNKKVEKQKITREDFDLIVKNYFGVYINELMCDD